MVLMFIGMGLIFTVCGGWFFGLMFTASMEEGSKKTVAVIMISFVAGFLISGLLTLEHLSDNQIWNNGYCKQCNTKYEIFDIEHHRNDGNTYYYKCENDHIISLHSQK